MAMQEASPAPAPSAQVVGNAFVEQYYHILHQSPNLVHRFYQESSFLSRPDSTDVMITVTSMQAINEKILSLNYEDYTAEIMTADAQESFEKGVVVLVTGCLTGKDDVRKKFTQTFFLAPQDKGYYVLNDVFRFIEEKDVLQMNSDSVNAISEDAAVAATTEPEVVMHASAQLAVDPATSVEEENLNNGGEVCDPLENEEEGSVSEEEIVEPSTHISQNEIVTGDSAPAVPDDAPKKSYASIVKVMQVNMASGLVYVPTRSTRVAAENTDKRFDGSAKSSSAAPISSDSTLKSSNVHEEAEGHSIYVRNLPYDATVEQLEVVFKKFGPIKHDGIQVRSSKQGFCFGFVEFEALSSMQSAIEASPIRIGDRQSNVEEKRTTTRVSGSGRGRYPSGRGALRNDSFRGRGKFGSGRSYERNEFRNQGEFSGRPRGTAGQNGGGSQWVGQNGGGQGGRQGGVNRNAA